VRGGENLSQSAAVGEERAENRWQESPGMWKTWSGLRQREEEAMQHSRFLSWGSAGWWCCSLSLQGDTYELEFQRLARHLVF
jgi:hypothetical protein